MLGITFGLIRSFNNAQASLAFHSLLQNPISTRKKPILRCNGGVGGEKSVFTRTPLLIRTDKMLSGIWTYVSGLLVRKNQIFSFLTVGCASLLRGWALVRCGRMLRRSVVRAGTPTSPAKDNSAEKVRNKNRA